MTDIFTGFVPTAAAPTFDALADIREILQRTPWPVVNVRGYGAVGDGIADDGPEIQAAIDAAGVSGVVVFPPGTYKSNQGLRVVSDQTLWGYSSRLCHLDCSGAGAHGIAKKATSATADNVHVRGLKITAGTVAGISTFRGVDLTDWSYAHLEDVFVEFAHTAFYLQSTGAGCFFNKLVRCRSRCTKYGVHFDDGVGGPPSNACTVDGYVHEDVGVWTGTNVALRLSGYGHKIYDFYAGLPSGQAHVEFAAQCGECVLVGLYLESGPTRGLDASLMNGTTRRNIVIGVHFDTNPATPVLDPNKALLLLQTDQSVFVGGPTLSHDEPFLELRSTDASGKRWRVASGGGSQVGAGNFGVYNDTDARLVLSLAGGAPASSLIVDASGYLTVNGGAALQKILTGTATWDPGNLADGAGATTTVTVTGAVVGDPVGIGFSNSLQGMLLTAYVSAANTVTVVLQNESGGALDLASGTLKALVWKV